MNKEKEMQPITIQANIQKRQIKALVDSEVDENYIH